MSEERELHLEDIIKTYKTSEGLSAICELLTLRREEYRNKLEKRGDDEVRGKALLCKELIQLLG